jgi:hypothetical protein
VKHKGVVARRRLKEVRIKSATRRTGTGYEASLAADTIALLVGAANIYPFRERGTPITALREFLPQCWQ